MPRFVQSTVGSPDHEVGPVEVATYVAVVIMQVALLVVGVLIYFSKKEAYAEVRTPAASTAEPEDAKLSGTAPVDDLGAESKKGEVAAPANFVPNSTLESVESLKQATKKITEDLEKLVKAVGQVPVDDSTVGPLMNQVQVIQENVGTLIKDDKKKQRFEDNLSTELEKIRNKVDSIASLEQTFATANRWTASEGNVVVIVCDSSTLPFRNMTEAYGFLLTEPSRSLFKGHKVGLWVAKAAEITELIKLDAPSQAAAELLWNDKSKEFTYSKDSKPELGDLAPKVLEKLEGTKPRKFTRVVLVCPADEPAPAPSAWDKLVVDVVLVATRPEAVPRFSVDWFGFCASRGGLITLVKPNPPAPVAAPAVKPVVGTAKGDSARTGGVVAQPVGTSTGIPAGAATSSSRVAAEDPNGPKPPAEVIKSLSRELRRLIQPTPSMDPSNG